MRGEVHDITAGRNGHPPAAPPRRLAAIVAADISGYSRLMEADEEGTHARVKRIERDVVQPTITEYRGRLVKTTGDGFIAMFDSPVEAVRCAIVIQQALVGRNAALSRPYWIEYRIGVNLGDIIIEPDDIYGDGVNIASRLEGIAAPGHVCISGGVYEQVKQKLVCGYESLGDRKVKNITDPVRVYRVLPDPEAFHRPGRRRETVLAVLLSLCLMALAAGAFWYGPVGFGTSRLVTALSPPSPTATAAAPAAQLEAAPPKPQATLPAPPVSPSGPSSDRTTPERTAAAAAPPARIGPAVLHEPETVWIHAGSFTMGGTEDASEKPPHQVTVQAFGIGKYPVSTGEWNECAAAKACGFQAPGPDDVPVANVSWTDAKQYVAWLATATHKPYRLPSEAEWEYAARGGTQTRYWWGDQMQPGMANCRNCQGAAAAPVKVGSLRPNPFGVYDMGGTVDQWVEDCWHKNYQGAPANGSPWIDGDCPSHVIRSGSWKNDASYVRVSNRDSYDTAVRYPTHGFRVALSP